MSRAQMPVVTVLLVTVLMHAAGMASTPMNTDLVEINHHQAATAAALLWGDHTLLEPGQTAVSGFAYVSSWATDALYGSWGVSLQTTVGRRLVLGLSSGYADAQFSTRIFQINAQYPLVSGPAPWLYVQAALGRQDLKSSESGAVTFFEFGNYWPIRPGNPKILLDDMTWTHGCVNLLLSRPIWRFRPLVSLGYIRSHYSWSGWEVPLFGGLDAGTGPALSDSGNTGTVTWSLGLGLEVGPVQPYVGLGVFSEGGLLLGRVSLSF